LRRLRAQLLHRHADAEDYQKNRTDAAHGTTTLSRTPAKSSAKDWGDIPAPAIWRRSLIIVRIMDAIFPILDRTRPLLNRIFHNTITSPHAGHP
jgi:hypothetical protein